MCSLQVVYDETGRVWIMLHSGSRNIGNTTATHYDRLAKQDLLQRGIASPSHLNYLELDSERGQRYLQVTLVHLMGHCLCKGASASSFTEGACVNTARFLLCRTCCGARSMLGTTDLSCATS